MTTVRCQLFLICFISVWNLLGHLRYTQAGCPTSLTWVTYTTGSSLPAGIPPSPGTVCSAIDPRAGNYPMTGHVITAGNPYTCRVVAPFVTGTPINTITDVPTFHVMGPVPADYEAVWIPVSHASLGFGAIKDPECAVTADRGNPSAVHPTYGRHYAAISNGRPGGLWPGTYCPALGSAVTGGQYPTINGSEQVLVVRQKTTAAVPNRAGGGFACYQNSATDGANLGTMASVRNMLGCTQLCLQTSNCTAYHVTKTTAQATTGLLGCQLRQDAWFVSQQNVTAEPDTACVLQN